MSVQLIPLSGGASRAEKDGKDTSTNGGRIFGQILHFYYTCTNWIRLHSAVCMYVCTVMYAIECIHVCMYVCMRMFICMYGQGLCIMQY